MRAASQVVRPGRSRQSGSRWVALLVLVIAAALSLAAQINGGPRTTNAIDGHFLAPPPSVTSIGGRHLPPPAPSVTSIPNFGYQYQRGQHFNGRRGGRGFHDGGFAYATPYYYPLDNSAYGYDYVGDGGPGLYSGPPLGNNDQTFHIVVEQPPTRPYSEGAPDQHAYGNGTVGPPSPMPASVPPLEIKPGEPTVLVFRNGQHLEVTNYAIMGDTLYVFDPGRKKIALTDLDLSATMKANDDRGLEFKVPASAAKPKSSSLPQSTAPDQTIAVPASVASARP